MKQMFLEMIFEQVRRNGAKMAIEDPENGAMTFRELADWSGKAYRHFKRRGIVDNVGETRIAAARGDSQGSLAGAQRK